MIQKIIESTDGKFLGVTFDDQQPINLSGFEFNPTKIEPVDAGLMRFSNSNYVILTKSVPAQN